jgi:hypothetical protein
MNPIRSAAGIPSCKAPGSYPQVTQSGASGTPLSVRLTAKMTGLAAATVRGAPVGGRRCAGGAACCLRMRYDTMIRDTMLVRLAAHSPAMRCCCACVHVAVGLVLAAAMGRARAAGHQARLQSRPVLVRGPTCMPTRTRTHCHRPATCQTKLPNIHYPYSRILATSQY